MTRRMLLVLSLLSCYHFDTMFGQTISTDSNQITFSAGDTVSISTPSSSGDGCGKMLVRDGKILHATVNSNTSVLQQWGTPFDGTDTPSNRWNFSYRIEDYTSQYSTDQLLIYDSDFTVLRYFRDMYNTGNGTAYVTNSGVSGQQVMLISQNAGLLYSWNLGESRDFVKVVSSFIPLNQSEYSLPIFRGKARLTPDKSKLVIWDQNSRIYLYGITGTLLGSYTGAQTEQDSPNLTNYIDIDSSSELAIIETDSQNPLTIIDLNTMEEKQQFSVQQKIVRAEFIVGTDLILILTPTQAYLLDTQTGSTVLVRSHGFTVTSTLIDATGGSFYLCQNNQIQSLKYEYSQGYNALKDPQVVYQLQFTETQLETTETVSASLESTTSVIDKIVLTGLSNPFTWFFLAFLNFFTISSHYVLLNMPLPKQLYEYLSRFYTEINSNIVSRLWTVPWHKKSNESVNRKKLKAINLTTDLGVGQTTNFLMALANIILFQAISLIVRNLDPNSFIRKLLYQPWSKIIYGQYVALILPLTCPWVFFILGGTKNNLSTFNLVIQYMFFGVSVSFCAYYLIELMDKNAEVLSKKRQASSIQDELGIRKTNKVIIMSKIEMQQQKQKQKIQTRVTAQITEQRSENSLSSSKKATQNTRKLEVSIVKTRKPSAFKELALSHRVANIHESKQKAVTFESVISQKLIRHVEVFSLLSLVSAQTFEDWYTVFCNFLYPLLLVLPWPEVSLVILFVYSCLGVLIAKRLKEYSRNKVILALYPLLYHLCFIIFRVTSHNKITVYTQIFALLVLLIGSIHQSGFLIYGIGKTVFIHYSRRNVVSSSSQVRFSNSLGSKMTKQRGQQQHQEVKESFHSDVGHSSDEDEANQHNDEKVSSSEPSVSLSRVSEQKAQTGPNTLDSKPTEVGHSLTAVQSPLSTPQTPQVKFKVKRARDTRTDSYLKMTDTKEEENFS